MEHGQGLDLTNDLDAERLVTGTAFEATPVLCANCHNSTYAILPSREANDNLQSIALQGYAGTVAECTVCHLTQPSGPGPHQ